MSRSAAHTRDQCSSTTTLPRVGDVLSAAMLCSILNDVRTRQRRHLATVHGIWGVVQGLRVRVMSSDDDGRPSVDVERGALLDSSGRLRTLTETTTLGVPPSGPGPWRVVGEFPTDDGPISPRWAAVTQGESPVDSTRQIELARWQAGGNLDFSFRPTAWRPGGRSSARLASSTAKRGSLPAVVSKNARAWSVRVDTSANLLLGGVAYIVMPTTPAAIPAGAAWSVTQSWDDGFVFEAVNWQMPAATANANAKKPPPPTLPVDLDWIGVETGSAGSRLRPPTLLQGTPP